MEKNKCTLEKDINQCPHFNPDNGDCEAENPCSFVSRAVERSFDKGDFAREERWYEKYYK